MNTLGLGRKVNTFGLGTLYDNIIPVIITGLGNLVSDSVNIIGTGIGIFIGNGSISSDESDMFGFGNSTFSDIEIRRMFKVGISRIQTFTNSIAAKIKLKVNK